MRSERQAVSTIPPCATASAMCTALSEVCNALNLHNRGQREIVAAQILELGLSGVTDSASLRDRVLNDVRWVRLHRHDMPTFSA
jgi:hypothetical protein